MAEKEKPVHGKEQKGPGGPGPRPKPKVENPWKIIRRLSAYVLKDYALAVTVVIVCILYTAFATVQGTLFMEELIDGYIQPLLQSGSMNFENLLQAILRVALFYGIAVIASYAQAKIMIYISQGTLRNLRNDLFSHMEKLPVSYFDTHAHGDIMSVYTNDTDTLRQMISQSIPQLFSSAITIVSVLGSMIYLSLPLTALTLFMVAVMLYMTKRLAGLSSRYFLAQQQDLGKVNGYIEEMMEGQKVVKVFCHEQISIKDFKKLNGQLFESAYQANRFANILMPVTAQLGNVSYVLCAIAGGILAMNGAGGFTIGKLASFLTFNKSFNQPINQVSMQLNAVIMAVAGAERVFKLLDEQPETDNGYVTLVNAQRENGKIIEAPDGERTGLWAWKHPHQIGRAHV